MSVLRRGIGILKRKGFKEFVKSGYLYFVQLDAVDKIITTLFDDVLYEKLNMYPLVGYWPQIREPRSFNEKLAHRKLLTDNEKFTEVQDKWAVRDYVKERVGDEVLTEVYHVTDDPETIPFDELPEKFVVKPTHGCNWIEIVEDKSEADFEEIKEKCREWLSKTFGQKQREYWYKDIEPMIMVEEFIEGENGEVPRDYKFFVFDGCVEFIEVDFDRFQGHKRTFFDREWSQLDFELGYPRGYNIDKPANLKELINIAEDIAEDFEFMRVDLYNIDDEEIYLGELTVCHASGRQRFRPKEWDFKMGEYW